MKFDEDYFYAFEFDWLAVDADGFVGFFSAGGSGIVPPVVAQNAERYGAAIATVLGLPPSGLALSAPTVGAGCENTWLLFAERGFHCFDSGPHEDRYERVAVPSRALTVSDFPRELATVLSFCARQNLRFAQSKHITRTELLGS